MNAEVSQDHPGLAQNAGWRWKTRRSCRSRDASRIHVSDASGNRARWCGVLPDLRNGAGTAGPSLQPRTRRIPNWFDDAAFLGKRRATVPVLFFGMSDMIPGNPVSRLISMQCHRLDWAVSRHAGGAVGRMAIFPARLGVSGESQLEHVHVDCAGHGRCLHLQRDCGSLPRFSRRLSVGRTAKFPFISRRRLRSPRWYCSGKCWNCGRAARHPRRFDRC